MNINDYLSVIPQVLVWTARRLENIWVVPWPLWIGGLFPIYLGTLYFMFWFRQGTVWPVRCNYPKTERNRPCRHPAIGEWHKCRHHNKVRRYKNHTVDPTICRWETFRNGRKVNSGKCGLGLFGRKPKRKTLLFYNGFARPVNHVLDSIFEDVQRLVSRLR